jgi:hypothetical protein
MSHPEKNIAKFQWLTYLIGMALILWGVTASLMGQLPLGAGLSIGGLGWLSLSLMMSRQVRRDLFGDLFDHPIEADGPGESV